MYWRIACILLLSAPRITEQCVDHCVPISELQTLCNTAGKAVVNASGGTSAGVQFYPAKPDTCFLYTYAIFTPKQQTLAYSIAKCKEWGNNLSLSCILLSPQDATEMADYQSNDILVRSQINWIGCSQTDTLQGPAGDWVWQAAVPSGTTYPAASIPWAPNQPNNIAGNATQCAYDGRSQADGISAENADPTNPFVSTINCIECECVPLQTATYPPTTMFDSSSTISSDLETGATGSTQQGITGGTTDAETEATGSTQQGITGWTTDVETGATGSTQQGITGRTTDTETGATASTQQGATGGTTDTEAKATGSTQQGMTEGTSEPNWIPWPSPTNKTTTPARYTTGSASTNPSWTQRRGLREIGERVERVED